MTFLSLAIKVVVWYLIIVFFLSRLFVPHLGFGRARLPDKLPPEMRRAIRKLKKRASSRHDFVVKAYRLITGRYFGSRMKMITCVDYLFRNLNWVWVHPGFMPCPQQNFVLRLFLVKSGLFKEEEIKVRHNFFDFDLHQYLSVYVDGSWINLDPWSKFLGKQLGEHAVWF
jgi:hypothetical protein